MTRHPLLLNGYKPPYEIPEEWWQHTNTRNTLLDTGYKPTFNIPTEWWQNRTTAPTLLRNGYLLHDPIPAKTPVSEAKDEGSTIQEQGTDQAVSQEAETLPGEQTLPGVASPSVLPPSPSPPPPVTVLSDPLHIQPVAPDYPMPTPGSTGHRRRGFRGFLKNLFHR